MKKKTEFIIAALTLMFLCFSIGYFVGRRSAPTSVSVSAGTVLTEADDAAPSPFTASAFYDEPSPSPPPSDAALPITPPPDPTAATTEPSDVTHTPDTEPTGAPAQTTDLPTEAPSETAKNAAESHYDEQGRLRINLATQTELETLPGIGPTLASRIIEFRDANGGFNRLTTLKSISGIGDKRYDAIKDLITVE